MRLIVNLGNSDIKLLCKNSKDIFIFRKRESYLTQLKALSKVLSSKEIEYNEKGEVLTSLFINFDEDNIDKKYEIDRIEFPILKAEINKINEFENEKITEVLCFITKQEKEVVTDTYLIKDILNGELGRKVFPNIKFYFATIKVDPSDYSEVLPLYSEFISKINLDNTVISIAQGTPAMCVGLSQSCARLKPNIRQYYASNNHESNDVIIKKLNQFSNSEINNLISQLSDDFKNGNYEFALKNINNSYLSTFDPIINILKYFIYRKNYQFENALNEINLIANKTTIFNNIIIPIRKNLLNILEANPDEFDYSNEKCPYLLYEMVSNIQLSLERKEYFYTMAFTSAFLDVLADFMIVRALKLDGLTFNKKNSSYEEIDRYVDNYSNIYPLTNKNHDIKDKLTKDNEGNIHLFINRNSRRALINWVSSHMGVDTAVKKYMDLMRINDDFENFKYLRNKLPIAHSVKGISLDEINKSLQNNDSSNNIFKIVKSLENLIKETLPIDNSYTPYYLDSEKIIKIIRKVFIN